MKSLVAVISDIGGAVLFLNKILSTLFRKPCGIHLVFEQVWKVTINAASTTGMAGFFVGAIITVQFTMQMREFDALGYLGALSVSGIVREIGPLLIAFMLSGKVGAFTSAEMGTMRVTEQIDAVRCLGADPIQEIVLPRFLGIVISSFFLLGMGLVMSIMGGMLLGNLFAGVNFEEYLRHIPKIVSWFSVASGLFKCFVFATVLATICTYKGFTASGGAKGVGLAVVSTAVATILSIVFFDWVTSFLTDVALNLFMGA